MWDFLKKTLLVLVIGAVAVVGGFWFLGAINNGTFPDFKGAPIVKKPGAPVAVDYCTVREKTIELTNNWEPINLHGCVMVDTVLKGPLKGRDDEKIEFDVVGITKRELREIRAPGGEGKIKYSLCPRFTKLPADWDCSPLPVTPFAPVPAPSGRTATR